MLQMSILDFLVTAVPEGLIYVLALYVLSKQPMDKKKYWLASVVHMVMIFVIRLLPISYGIHTIMIMVSLIVIGITINKLDAISVIRATISTVILQFVSEGISVFGVEQVTGRDISDLMRSRGTKMMCGLISLFILVVIILIIKRRYEKNAQCGKNIV